MPSTIVPEDLITKTTLRRLGDWIGSIYDRFNDCVGDGDEPLLITLNTTMNATVSTVVLIAPGAGTWADVLPDQGTVVVENERIRYAGVTTNTLTVQARGADGTTPAAHTSGVTVYLPASASRWAKRISEEIVGDGGSVVGVGERSGEMVRILFPPFDDQKDTILEIPGRALSPYFSALDSLISQVGTAPDIVTGTPSFGAIIVNSLNAYLRYLNDRDTGVPFNCLMPSQTAKSYWLYTGGTPLDNKVVFPARVTYARVTVSNAGVMAVTMTGDDINRYGAQNSDEWIQGYAAQVTQARVTSAGNGSVPLTANAQGMDVQGKYFGRPATLEIRCLSVALSDTVTILGRTYTAIGGSSNPVPNHAFQFSRASDDNTCASNLADAINNADNPGVTEGLQGVVTAVWAGLNAVRLTLTDPADTQNVRVDVSSSAHLGLFAGSTSGLAFATFGGGAGPNADEIGNGSDMDVTAVTTDDDPRNFTGTLNLGAVGNVVTLLNGIALDRVMKVLKVTGTPGGVSLASAFVIESVLERTVP